MARRGWRLTFRRWLGEHLQNKMRDLMDILMTFAVNNEEDYPKWCWDKSGDFTVKSTYKQLSCNETGAAYRMI